MASEYAKSRAVIKKLKEPKVRNVDFKLSQAGFESSLPDTIQKRKKPKSVVERNRSLAEQLRFYKDRLENERQKLYRYSANRQTINERKQKEIVRLLKREILRLENKMKSLTDELR